MIPDFPTTRTEAYLAAILGGDGALPVPESRTDLYLAKIAGMDTEIPAEPQTRSEKYLAAILGADLVLPAPLSRKDLYLAKKAGMDVEIPEPLTRLEAYLAEWAGGSGTLKTVTGSLIHITDALASPVNALSVNIDPVQSGSGDPSPDNVRPISGHTQATVTRTGKNLLPKMVAGTYGSRGVTVVVDSDGVATMSGTTTSKGNIAIIPFESSLVVPPTPNVDVSGLKLHMNNSVAVSSAFAAYVEENASDSAHVGGGFTVVNRVFNTATGLTSVIGKELKQIRVYANASGMTCSGTFAPAVLNNVTAVTPYEPYAGTVIPVTFPTPPGTVYGGTLDVLSGVLTVERANIASYAGETLPGEWISDRDVYSPGETPTTGAQVVYKLAAPLTYQLTPTEVTTLLGENNIWADTGDTTLTYMARG